MKVLMLAAVAAVALAAPTAAMAQSGGGSETVFQCTLRNGKTVRVTAQGGTLVYEYGRGRRTELSLRGSAGSGNIFYLTQRYASIQSQLRFANGEYSYIVHSMGASVIADSRGISGLVVMRGNRRIADHGCRHQTEFTGGFELLQGLPEDRESYSVM